MDYIYMLSHWRDKDGREEGQGGWIGIAMGLQKWRRKGKERCHKNE
jgi:hypothetical protein